MGVFGGYFGVGVPRGLVAGGLDNGGGVGVGVP